MSLVRVRSSLRSSLRQKAVRRVELLLCPEGFNLGGDFLRAA